MDSTSTSKTDTILTMEDVNLDFNLDLYGHYFTFRDMFVRSIVNPLSLFNKKKFRVLSNISFELKRGERLGLIGMNGCGKTTLCRIISGMYTPKSGLMDLKGECRAIFDINIGITPELTGRENAELLTELIFPEAKNKQDLVDEALEFSELNEFIDVPFYKYSKGMKTRLCLSLISSKPSDLLILDEVYSGADTYFFKKVSERVKSMIEGSGAVIFVTHHMEEILSVCNRVIVIDKGKMLFDGDPHSAIEFYNKNICDIPPEENMKR